MSNVSLDQLQADVAARLAVKAFLSGVPIFIEDDPNGTAKDQAELEEKFERALADVGLALVVMSPFPKDHDFITSFEITMQLSVSVAVVENPARNRAAGGARKSCLAVVREVIAALMPAYQFENPPFSRPETFPDLNVFYVRAVRSLEISAEA